MARTQRFRAVLAQDDQTTATHIVVPFDVHDVFGTRARVHVRGALNGTPFRSSIAPYGGRHYLLVTKALRDSAQVKAGDVIAVVLERDEAPRVVTVPKDLARALRASPAAKAVWDRLSYSHRKEYVRAVTEARKPETRVRRIEHTIAALAAIKR